MQHLLREACLVGGAWLIGDSWHDVRNPANGKIVGRTPIFGAKETVKAIEAASEAMPAWAALPAAERAAVLIRLFDLMQLHSEPLARLLTAEQGKPITEARGEIAYAASFVRWFAEEARRVYGETIPGHASDKRLMVMRQPIGVVGAITPWNFPSAMVTRKIAPALAAGCAVVLKPASQTPFSALALGVLAQEAGLPPGLLNIVTGDAAAIGDELTKSPIVRKLTFTGSTHTGARLYAQCAPTIKKLSLELGGNAPFIVFDDADLDAAVEGAILSKFRNAGQTCVCANRLYVQDAAHDAFVEKLVAATAQLKVGPGDQDDTRMGPLVDDRAVVKVREHIADAIAQGGEIAVGGDLTPLRGRFFAPTVITGVTNTMLVTREETFGPLAPITRFRHEDDVIKLANASEFGLAAYFYTRDVSRVWRVAEALEAGMVGVNTGLISTEVAPFGGVKQSGLGREGSRHGLEDYLELKYVCLGL